MSHLLMWASKLVCNLVEILVDISCHYNIQRSIPAWSLIGGFRLSFNNKLYITLTWGKCGDNQQQDGEVE